MICKHDSVRRAGQVLAVVAVVVVVGVMSSATAGAAGTPVTTVSPSSGQYSSLAAGLVNVYATQQDQQLGTFLNSNGASTTGLISESTLVQLQAQAASGLSVPKLNSTVLAASPTLNPAGYASMSAYVKGLTANESNSVDAQVTSAAANWAAGLANLRAPALSTPVAGTPSAAPVPPGALMFGNFIDQTEATMAANHPDLYAQIAATGLGTPAAQAAWNASMATAAANTTANFSANMPDPCGAALMDTMASGTPQPSSAACAPCVVGGMYLHSQMQSIFSPQTSSVTAQSSANLVPPAAWSQLPGWQKGIVTSQNPSLAQSVNQNLGGSSAASACVGASGSTSNTLKSTLPGIFANLAP